MATYLPGVTDTNLEPVLYTPDYAFLRHVLGKKTAQYEQGLKSVSAAYQNLQQELTDPANAQKRDEFLKAAESQLQKVAGADLSLQQNVNSANAIFDPLVKDSAFVYDAFHTRRLKNEMSQMESWLNSEDLTERKKFNQDLYDWLKRDFNSLKSGNGDIANYRVQGRRAFAYIDPQDLIKQEMTARGFKEKKDIPGQPYLVTVEGGPEFVPEYKAFAREVLASNPLYQQQVSLLAQNQKEKILEQYRSNPVYAGMTEPEIWNNYSQSDFDRNRNRQKDYLGSLQEEYDNKKAEFLAYSNSKANEINTDPQEQQRALQRREALLSMKSQLEDLNGEFVTKYGSDDEDKNKRMEKYVNSVVANPDGHFASQYMTNDIINFTNLQSSFGTRTIKKDEAYIDILRVNTDAMTTLNNIQDDSFDNQIALSKLGIDMEQLKLDKEKAVKGTKTRDASGNEITRQSDIEFVGASQTAVNVTTGLQKLKSDLQNYSVTALQNLTGVNGALSLLEGMGVKPEDVSLVRQYVGRKFENGNNYTSATKEEAAALKNANVALFAFAKENGKEAALTQLRNDIKDKKLVNQLDFPALLKLATQNYVPRSTTELNAKSSLAQYDRNTESIKDAAAKLQAGKDIMVQYISGDKTLAAEYAPLMVKQPDGKMRLVDENDIAAKIPLTGWVDANGNSVKLTQQEKADLASGYVSGNIKVEQGTFNFSSPLSTSKPLSATTVDYKGSPITIYRSGIFPLSSDDYQKKIKKINERIPLPVLDGSVGGAATSSSIFVLRNELKDQVRTMLVSDATTTNSNIKVNKEGTTEFTQVPPAEQVAIRNAMAEGKGVLEMFLLTSSPENNGKQAVKAVLKEGEGEDAKINNYLFPINVDSKSPELFRIFDNVDQSNEFLRQSRQNKPYELNYFEGVGIKASFYANQPGSKEGVIKIAYKPYNAATKTYADEFVEVDNMPFDLNKVTFSELRDVVEKQYINPYIQQRMAYNKQLQQPGAAGNVNFSAQLLKGL